MEQKEIMDRKAKEKERLLQMMDENEANRRRLE